MQGVPLEPSDGNWAISRIDQVSADGSIGVGRQEAEWRVWLGRSSPDGGAARVVLVLPLCCISSSRAEACGIY